MFTATKTFALALLCITSATAAASIDGKTYECDGTISSVNGAAKCDGVPIEPSRSLFSVVRNLASKSSASIDGKTYGCDGTISSVNGAVKCDGVPIEPSRSLFSVVRNLASTSSVSIDGK